MTTKTPIRTVYDGTGAAIGLAEFQNGEVVGVEHGGTGGNTVAAAKLTLSLTDSNIRSLFSVSGSGSYSNSTGIITVTGGVTSVGGATGTVSNAQLISAVTSGELLANINLTGTPVAPTAASGTNSTQIATTAFVTSAVSNLIDSAPGALDTLNELAAAINDDNNFATTIVTQLNNKANTASLTTANVTELTNLYFTNSRAREAISATGSLNYSNSTGIISFSQGNSDTVAEGSTNLYFTNARVYSNVVSIGYATNSNVALKANVVDLTTANVTELTNLYFTNARARAAFTAGSGIEITSGTISLATTFDYGLIDGALTASNDYGSI